MPIIKINVKDKIATLDNPEDFIVCGNSDYTIQFNFDGEWSGYTTKTARFVTDDGYQEVTFNGINCTAPKISNSLGVRIGVYAGNLHTTTPAFVNTKKSILCGSGTHVTPPTDVYNQLVAAIDEVADDKVDKVAGKGLSTNDYTNTDKQKVQNAIGDAPIDNKEYARKNGAWAEVQGGGGTVAWNDITGKPSSYPPSAHSHDGRYYTEGEVDALLVNKADTDDIPTKTSDLDNDSGFLTQHQDISGKADKATTYTKTEVDGLLDDKADTEDIPTKTSELTNDSGFLTEHQSLDGYRTASEQDEIDAGKLGTAHATASDAHSSLFTAKLDANLKGAAGGIAELDANGKVPSAQLPSYVDDVLEYSTFSALPATGESGKIYVTLDTNKTYRWGGSAYVEISASLALGEGHAEAGYGDWCKAAYDHSQDASVHVTAAQKSAWTAKQDALEFGHNSEHEINTINGVRIAAESDYAGNTISNTYATKTELGNKVDKVSGKGLSTNDYTTTEKNKLAGIAAGATAVTESTVSGWGFTKNAGTITGITMNGSSKGTSGVVDLGTVLTSHQSLSNYYTKAQVEALLPTVTRM